MKNNMFVIKKDDSGYPLVSCLEVNGYPVMPLFVYRTTILIGEKFKKDKIAVLIAINTHSNSLLFRFRGDYRSRIEIGAHEFASMILKKKISNASIADDGQYECNKMYLESLDGKQLIYRGSVIKGKNRNTKVFRIEEVSNPELIGIFTDEGDFANVHLERKNMAIAPSNIESKDLDLSSIEIPADEEDDELWEL